MKKFQIILAAMTAVMLSLHPVDLLYAHNNNRDGKNHPSYTPTVDSLLNLIETASGPELLKHYPRLHKALYEVNDLDVHLGYNSEFAEAAQAAKDKKMEAISAVLRIEALYNYMAPDSVLLAESLQALDIIRGVPGAEVHYFYTASVLGDVYMLQGKYEDALETAEKFYAEAKEMGNNSGMVASLQTMGKAYEELGLHEKAETSFRRSIEAADEKVDHGMKGEAYSYLVDMLNGQGRYEDALEASREFEAYLKRIDADNGELRNLCFLNWLGYAASYTKLGQYDLAWKYIAKAERYPVAGSGMGMYSVENERFPLLLAQNRHAEAERTLDRMEEILGDDASAYQARLKMKEARADLYHRWGQFDKSSALYKEYIAKKDSMQRVEMAEKLHSLRTRYEVDRLEMQRVQQARSFRNTLRWFGFVTLCGIAVIALITTLYRKKNAAYKVLAQRVSEWAHSGESRYSPAAPGKVSGQSQNEPLTEEEAKIMSFIETEMTSGHAYRDAALNMDSLADRLGVHRNTVSKAVNKSTGNNFSYYVNGYRIREAVRILSESDREKIYIEELAEHVGFTNHSSFYRAFKQFTALSPAEFRKNKSDGPKNQ